MHYLSEQHILIFLVQVLLLLGLARLFGELFRRFNQPSITAEILVGILLGPTILGRVSPSLWQTLFPPDLVQQNMLETVAWIGILFFLLKTGLEMDFSSAWRQRGDALKISLTDVIVPMLIAFVPALFIPDQFIGDPTRRLLFAVFLATIMTISALPVTARVLQDLKLFKTDMGFLIMGALSLNDIIGWVIFTIVLGFVTQASPDAAGAALILAGTLLFTFVCLTGGRRLSDIVISRFSRLRIPEPAASLTFVSLLGALCGIITLKIGIHALFGFFIAGMMAGEATHLTEKTRNIISQMVQSLFIPLFFANIGLKIDFLRNFHLPLVLLIVFIGTFGRYIGAWLGVRLTRQPKANHALISIAHTPGGEMQIVVSILALEYGLITEPVFVAIVTGAVVSSVLLGPWMNAALRRRKEISLLEFFSKRAIIAELGAQNREQAIEELCRVLCREEELDSDRICPAVLQREQAMGTAIEEGIALPHARLDFLRRPFIALGRAREGIDWNSPDGKPARFVFLILTPAGEDDLQVNILSGLARLMSNVSLRQALHSAESRHDIISLLRHSCQGQCLVRQA